MHAEASPLGTEAPRAVDPSHAPIQPAPPMREPYLCGPVGRLGQSEGRLRPGGSTQSITDSRRLVNQKMQSSRTIGDVHGACLGPGAHVGGGGLGALGAAPPTSAFTSTAPQVRWRLSLLEQTQRLQGLLRRQVNLIHQNEIMSPSVKAVVCVCCRVKKFKLDVVMLMCCPERRPRACRYVGFEPPPHVVCLTCMAKLVSRSDAHLCAMEQRERSGDLALIRRQTVEPRNPAFNSARERDWHVVTASMRRRRGDDRGMASPRSYVSSAANLLRGSRRRIGNVRPASPSSEPSSNSPRDTVRGEGLTSGSSSRMSSVSMRTVQHPSPSGSAAPQSRGKPPMTSSRIVQTGEPFQRPGESTPLFPASAPASPVPAMAAGALPRTGGISLERGSWASRSRESNPAVTSPQRASAPRLPSSRRSERARNSTTGGSLEAARQRGASEPAGPHVRRVSAPGSPDREPSSGSDRLCVTSVTACSTSSSSARSSGSAELSARESEATCFVRSLGVKIIPCPLCKSPNVVQVQSIFHPSLERTYIDHDGTVTQYRICVAATKAAQDNFTVEEVYSNQRRHFFGAFSAENLLTLDFRGPYSTENGCEVEHSLEKPNRRWVWIEVDAPDLTVPRSGKNGWLYRHNWSNDLWAYQSKVSFFHLVRTRRLLHTRIRLSDLMRAELEMLQVEIEEERNNFAIQSTR